MNNQEPINKTVTVRLSGNENHAMLRNGLIQNAQFIDVSIRNDNVAGWRVWIEAGNDRTGVFKGWITMPYAAMVDICNEFAKFHNELMAKGE